MAANYSVGKMGIIKLGADTIANLTDWSMTLEMTEIDLRTIGDEWATFAAGSKSWSCTANAVLDMTDTAGQYDLVNELLSGDGVLADSVLLYAEDGSSTDGYFKGSAVVTATSPSNPGNDDVLRLSVTLRGTGALTWTAGT